MDEEDVKQPLKTSDKPWLFKKGGMPGPGRPKGSGKSLKEYSKEFLAAMTEEERLDFLDGLPKDIIWKMAEGNPKNDIEHSGTVNIANILNEIENGQTPDNKGMENQ